MNDQLAYVKVRTLCSLCAHGQPMLPGIDLPITEMDWLRSVMMWDPGSFSPPAPGSEERRTRVLVGNSEAFSLLRRDPGPAHEREEATLIVEIACMLVELYLAEGLVHMRGLHRARLISTILLHHRFYFRAIPLHETPLPLARCQLGSCMLHRGLPLPPGACTARLRRATVPGVCWSSLARGLLQRLGQLRRWFGTQNDPSTMDCMKLASACLRACVRE
jgi:hypothetical protein